MGKKQKRWQGRLNDVEYAKLGREKHERLKRLSNEEYLAMWNYNVPNITNEEDKKKTIIQNAQHS